MRQVMALLCALALAGCREKTSAPTAATNSTNSPTASRPDSTMPPPPATQPELAPVDALEAAAEQGDPVAQAVLGTAYALGQGVTANPVEALKWFRKSAAQGNAEGQFQVGKRLAEGVGAPPDPAAAVPLYRKAAEQEAAALVLVY